MTHHDKARELVERLRGLEVCYQHAGEAADLITALIAENERLRGELDAERALSDRMASALEYTDDYCLSYPDLGFLSGVVQPAIQQHAAARAALTPAPQPEGEAVPKCVACEDSPKHPNIPCAVCGAHTPQHGETVAEEAMMTDEEISEFIADYGQPSETFRYLTPPQPASETVAEALAEENRRLREALELLTVRADSLVFAHHHGNGLEGWHKAIDGVDRALTQARAALSSTGEKG